MAPENDTVASRARLMAERIRNLPREVVAAFQLCDPVQRMKKMDGVSTGISCGMFPVISWLERRRPAHTADLVKRRMYHALNEAVQCAGLDSPEYEGGIIGRGTDEQSEGAYRTAILLVFTRTFAESLMEWANDIEAEEQRLASPPAGAQPTERSGPLNSIRLVGEVWHLRFGAEILDYPKQGNQCLEWLAKLLAAPNRSYSVADLRGDPEGKLAGDASLRGKGECVTDAEGVRAIKNRLEEINDLTDETGGCETLETEKANLLRQLQEADADKQFTNPLKVAHHNVAEQFRNRLRGRWATTAPNLVAHLKAALRLDFPHFTYAPPAGTPSWEV